MNGLVNSRKSSRMIFYRYNLRNPVAEQLKTLLNVDALRDMVAGLRDHAKRVIVFGSYAEGTNAVSSDIDLFVLTEDSEKVREHEPSK